MRGASLALAIDAETVVLSGRLSASAPPVFFHWNAEEQRFIEAKDHQPPAGRTTAPVVPGCLIYGTVTALEGGHAFAWAQCASEADRTQTNELHYAAPGSAWTKIYSEARAATESLLSTNIVALGDGTFLLSNQAHFDGQRVTAVPAPSTPRSSGSTRWSGAPDAALRLRSHRMERSAVVRKSGASGPPSCGWTRHKEPTGHGAPRSRYKLYQQ